MSAPAGSGSLPSRSALRRRSVIVAFRPEELAHQEEVPRQKEFMKTEDQRDRAREYQREEEDGEYRLTNDSTYSQDSARTTATTDDEMSSNNDSKTSTNQIGEDGSQTARGDEDPAAIPRALTKERIFRILKVVVYLDRKGNRDKGTAETIIQMLYDPGEVLKFGKKRSREDSVRGLSITDVKAVVKILNSGLDALVRAWDAEVTWRFVKSGWDIVGKEEDTGR